MESGHRFDAQTLHSFIQLYFVRWVARNKKRN